MVVDDKGLIFYFCSDSLSRRRGAENYRGWVVQAGASILFGRNGMFGWR